MKTQGHFTSVNEDEQYKIWRNKVTELINDSKKRQYQAIIEENNNKSSSVWRIFKEPGATKNKSKCAAGAILIDGKEITDPQDIANEFNHFFVSVASNLKELELKPNFKLLEHFCD